MKPNWALLSLLLLGVVLGQFSTSRSQVNRIELLSKDYEDAIMSGDRTLRSRTDSMLPRMGGEQLAAISTVAKALSWPWECIAAAEKVENGGLQLELGIQFIPLDIRQNFPPKLWQRAAGARIMQQEAGKMIFEDPEVTMVFASRLSKRWHARDPKEWRDNFIASMNKWRGEGESARPAKSPKHKKGRKRSKA